MLPKRFRKIRAQLILWYAGVFVISYAGLFALARVSLSSLLQKQDQEFALNQLSQYALRYKTDGLPEMMKEIDMERNVDGYRQTITRLSDPRNTTLYLSAPDVWHRYNLKSLEAAAPKPNGWIHLPKPNDEDRLDVGAIRLSDGNLLQVGIDSGDRNDSLENFSKLFFAGAFVVILIGAGSGAFLAARWLRPIQHLTATVRSISETGRMSARVVSRGSGDELDELGSLFNQMLSRIESLINGMRDSLDNIAHDLRTPMTRLRGAAENALGAPQPHETCQEALADCLEQSEQVVTMLNTLMDISEAETGAMQLNLEPVHLAEVVEEVVDVYRYVAEEKNISIALNLPADLTIEADRNRLKQVIGNLLDNAIKYTAPTGTVQIGASADHGQAQFLVQDNGIGIPAHETARIWERLYRGDQSRSQKGLGLGLNLVKAIVSAHGGHIVVSSQKGQGSIFSVRIPISQKNSANG